MVCRTTRIGSAVTSYARLNSGLLDQQTLSTFHELLREGRSATIPSSEQVNALIDDAAAQVRADESLSQARRTSLLSRLDAAREQSMDGRTYYASQRILERCGTARRALDEHYDEAARTLGVSRSEVESFVNDRIRSAEESGRSTTAPTSWQREFANEHRDLPLDRATAYGMHALEERLAQHRATAPTRPAVTRQPVQSRALTSMGYDPATGRLEVTFTSDPNRPYAYRIPQDEYERLRNAPSVGSYFARNIRRNPQYQYTNSAEQQAAGTLQQCATCGQFAGPGHTCPVRDSVEERNRTERIARTRARAARRIATGATAPETQADVHRIGYTAQRRYTNQAGTLRTMPVTSMQQEARQHGNISVPFAATITTIDVGNGPQRDGAYQVIGRANVRYLGRGRGYEATPVLDPGDSGNDQLRCRCPQYRANYDCPHVRQAVAELNSRLNAASVRDVPTLSRIQAEVTADLARDRAESIAAQNTAVATWGAPENSYTDDPDAFQRDYRAAKRRRDAGESAVPYMTENATDGLGARGTGRAFGVELEFDFPSNVDRSAALRAIGRDLHREGLTSSSDQRGYHSAEYRGYTENHRGGWSYESDCTVAGEIVSPIMYDEPETWANIAKVCEIVRRHGGTASTRAGSHIHVGVGDYDHTIDNHNRLMRTFAANEDLLYRLSSNPERGTHRGPQWCAPNRVPAAGYRDVSNARSSNNGHHLGVNMQSVAGRNSDHVEFRTWDSSLDPSVIQTQIKVSLAMTASALRDADHTPTATEPLGSHRAHNRQEHGASRRLTGDAWAQDTASFRSFADRMFRRASDKAQLTSLFAVTKWQRTR